MSQIAFFDLEVGLENKKIRDIGCVRSDEAIFHKNHLPEFFDFIHNADFLCGHNIIDHDLVYLQKSKSDTDFGMNKSIDTLLLSPLLFPRKPYHHLFKDDKLQTDELNNPVNDAKKARDLLFAEQLAFQELSDELKEILYNLLRDVSGFAGFFKYVGYSSTLDSNSLVEKIKGFLNEKICTSFDLAFFIKEHPVSLAYALVLLNCDDRYSITPPWVLRTYPEVESALLLMRNTPCLTGCLYCDKAHDPFLALQRHFGLSTFRSYQDEPLQEKAIAAAINGKSLLAVFPTGGGKSITFQLPALMSGENAKALTVVISPLQSLMKDQVDNLEKKGITEAVTINGLLDPIERSQAIERIEDGYASLLYISPESLRSITIERLLLKRKIARFVIDEAHCFSSWGQDFRVDYLYIAQSS